MQLQWAFPITVETQLHHVWAEAILVSPAVAGVLTCHPPWLVGTPATAGSQAKGISYYRDFIKFG